MRFDHTRTEKHVCIVCDCTVPPKDSVQHAIGKKHFEGVERYAFRCHESSENLSTLMEVRYDREIQIFRHQNSSTMAEYLQSLAFGEDY